MLLKVSLEPFKDFWFNCNFNTTYSVLISLDASYRQASYLNNYQYQIRHTKTPLPTQVDYLILVVDLDDFLEKHLGTPFLKLQPLHFKGNSNYVTYLKKLVKQKKLITVGVDLFQWIPNSVCWYKQHWNHYSLISGFDDEKQLLYVLDDSYEGFEENEIPEKRFITAIQNSTLEPHGYILQPARKIKPFELSVSEVNANAERLVNEIAALDLNSLWRFSKTDFVMGYMREWFTMIIFQIANRHKANQYLFQALQEQGKMDDTQTEMLLTYCRDLWNGWRVAQNTLFKAYAADDHDSSIAGVIERSQSLFQMEVEMWKKFLANS